jgi:hypothetical protein
MIGAAERKAKAGKRKLNQAEKDIAEYDRIQSEIKKLENDTKRPRMEREKEYKALQKKEKAWRKKYGLMGYGELDEATRERILKGEETPKNKPQAGKAAQPKGAGPETGERTPETLGKKKVQAAEKPGKEKQEGNEKSDFEKVQEKYKNATFEEGDDDQIQAGKELISGKWKLVEADTPTASHDEINFHKTPGFPTTEDGSTINDRDYGHDKAAQEIVMEIGADYDGRAVSVDNPVIVTKDGIVISGNNRTMSGKIAAMKGTDKDYIEVL